MWKYIKTALGVANIVGQVLVTIILFIIMLMILLFASMLIFGGSEQYHDGTIYETQDITPYLDLDTEFRTSRECMGAVSAPMRKTAPVYGKFIDEQIFDQTSRAIGLADQKYDYEMLGANGYVYKN